MLQAAALKDLANKAFAAKDYDSAIELYTEAIALEPKNHVFYSNRSAAQAGKKQWAEALADAEEVRRFAFVVVPSTMGENLKRFGSVKLIRVWRNRSVSSTTRRGAKDTRERELRYMALSVGAKPSRRTKKALNSKATIQHQLFSKD